MSRAGLFIIAIVLLSLIACTDNTEQLNVLTGQLDVADQKREASFEQFEASLQLVWDFALENFDGVPEANEAIVNNQAELVLMKAEIAQIRTANKDVTDTMNTIKQLELGNEYIAWYSLVEKSNEDWNAIADSLDKYVDSMKLFYDFKASNVRAFDKMQESLPKAKPYDELTQLITNGESQWNARTFAQNSKRIVEEIKTEFVAANKIIHFNSLDYWVSMFQSLEDE